MIRIECHDTYFVHQCAERNKAYYKKYPEDIDAVHGLAFHIKSKGGLQLPSGGVLTVRGFLTLGRNFGMHGGLDSVHDLVFRMKRDIHQFQFITRPTLSALESALSFDDNVIYAILHESIYCENEANKWAADRVGRSLREFACERTFLMFRLPHHYFLNTSRCPKPLEDLAIQS
jgi:hypothetical protein